MMTLECAGKTYEVASIVPMFPTGSKFQLVYLVNRRNVYTVVLKPDFTIDRLDERPLPSDKSVDEVRTHPLNILSN